MTEEPDPTDDQRLMAYLRGTLDPEATRAVETAAASHPEVVEDMALLRGIAALRDTPQAAPGELGWARLSRAIDAEKPAGRRHWRPALQAAAAAVAAVILWQTLAVPYLPGRDPGAPGYAPVTEAASGRLTVAFAPEATEVQLRALLAEIGAEIVGGPSALGLWRLDFPDPARREAGLARLEAETGGLVESVQTD